MKRHRHPITCWRFLARVIVARCWMRVLMLSILVASASAQDMPRWGAWEKAWAASAASFGAATALDIASSYGNVGRERNPVFGSTFDGRDAALKVGVAAGIITAQYLLVRRWPDSRAAKTFALINFSMAGATAGVAARNWRITQ